MSDVQARVEKLLSGHLPQSVGPGRWPRCFSHRVPVDYTPAHVAAVLAEAGLLADPQPMLDGQIVLSGYCSEDHGHDLDCLFRAARRELATAAEQEQCSECGAGTATCAQSRVKCCPDCKHGWKALCPALAVEARRQRDRAEKAEADLADAEQRGAVAALRAAADDLDQYADRRGETAGSAHDWDNPVAGSLAVGKVNGLGLAVDRLRARADRIEGDES